MEPIEPEIELTSPVTRAFEMNARLGRGINLGNALEAPSEGQWGMYLESKYFSLIAEAGFDSVRVPIRWSAHAELVSPYTINSRFFDRIDWAIDQALQNNLNVVINMHHYDQIFSDPQAHEERFLAMWQQIAEHYQDYPEALYFEILNEPHDQLNAFRWDTLFHKTLEIIRQTNPQRMVIIGPVGWNNVTELITLHMPENDQNLIATFHYYNPFPFTHQDAEWVEGSAAWHGTIWQATSTQTAAVDLDLDRAAVWSKHNNRPVYLGEFGAYSKADLDSRVRWTSYVARGAEERGFSWAYWEFGAGFGIYDRFANEWVAPLRNALIPQGE